LTALAELRRHYDNRTAVAKEQHARGTPVAGYTSNTVPRELLRAAGYFPVLLSPPAQPTPLADKYMEPAFETRIRVIFEHLLAGDWSFLERLIIPRTSEGEHKLFLYLREVMRQEGQSHFPSPYFYDLLHTRTPLSEDYARERTRELYTSLGSPPLGNAIAEQNRVRAAVRRLLELREGEAPRLRGSDALMAIGASYFMEPDEFVRLAAQAAAETAASAPVDAPRLLVKGYPCDHPELHRAVEATGGNVVAEDDWWGSRCAGEDVGMEGDPLEQVFRKYYIDAPSPRVFPPEIADAWFEERVQRGIDGVLFYLPADDDVYGWDYPRHKRFCDERGVPALRVRDSFDGLSGFVGSLRRKS